MSKLSTVNRVSLLFRAEKVDLFRETIGMSCDLISRFTADLFQLTGCLS